MTVVASDVKALATELASVADATITTWLAIVERRIHRASFGDRADDAVTFLAAHCVTLAVRANAGDSGSVGHLASRSVGGVSVTFATMPVPFGDEVLASTMWGQLYIDLRKGTFADRRI